MPRYQVNSPGTHDGVLYGPDGKRPVLVTDKPLDPVPSWVTRIKDLSAAQTAAQRKKSAAATKAAKKKIEADKNDQGAAAIESDNPQNALAPQITKSGSKVKTL